MAENTNDKFTPNAVTAAALAEYDEMKNHPERYKIYHSFQEILDKVSNEELDIEEG